MELFTYLMAKNDHNTSVKKDLFSYLLGKNQSGTYTDYSGTSLSINNTKKGKMKVNLLGNTSQNTTTGKNLFNINGIDDISSASYKINIVNDTIVITDNTVSSGYTNTGKKLKDLCPSLKVNDVVYLFFNTTSSVANKNYIYLNAVWPNGSSKTITQEMLNSNLQLYGGYNETAIISNFIITKANDSTYEPYTGGIASPNPDYPQPVNVVSGDNEINVEGKNYLPTLDSNTWTLENGATISNGILTLPNSNSKASITIKWDKSLYCYESFEMNSGNTAYTSIYMYNENMQQIDSYGRALSSLSVGERYEIDWRGRGANFSTTSFIKITFQRHETHAPNQYSIKFAQITKNSTDTYEPYTSTSYPIHLGEHWLGWIGDYKDRFIRTTGKNLWNSSTSVNGYLNADGTLGATTGDTYMTSDFIPVKPNTSYYKVETGTPRTKYFDSNKQPLNTSTYQDISVGANAGTFTTPDNCYYVRISIYQQTVKNENVMINEGSTALPYEPYGTNEWYLEKKIGKVVLDGNTNFNSVDDLGSGTYRFVNNSLLDGINSISYTYGLEVGYSNYFHYLMQYSGSLSNQRVYTADKGLIIITSVASTSNELKTWLGTHNTEIYYPLATPTYTKITGTLKDELEAVWRANSYNGQTNISQVNNDLPFNMNVSIKVGN